MVGMQDFDYGAPLGSTSVGRRGGKHNGAGEDKQQLDPLQTRPRPQRVLELEWPVRVVPCWAPNGWNFIQSMDEGGHDLGGALWS